MSLDYNKISPNSKAQFDEMPQGMFLVGLLSAFDNRFQAGADAFFKELTWKQFFAIICINLCRESPTIVELAEIMGSSHQNVKQILNKLEKIGFVRMTIDEKDKRKQRIQVTESCRQFCAANNAEIERMIGKLFNGISEEKLTTTILTIAQMERNLKEL